MQLTESKAFLETVQEELSELREMRKAYLKLQRESAKMEDQFKELTECNVQPKKSLQLLSNEESKSKCEGEDYADKEFDQNCQGT